MSHNRKKCLTDPSLKNSGKEGFTSSRQKCRQQNANLHGKESGKSGVSAAKFP